MYSTSLTSNAFLPSVSIMGVYGTEYLRHYSICFFSVLQLWLLVLLYEQNDKTWSLLNSLLSTPIFFSKQAAEMEGFFTVHIIMMRSDLKESMEFIRKWKCEYKADFKNPLIIS